jgi:2'-5' RNA ligase
VRLFLAINLPSEIRREIADVTGALREVAPDVAWTREPQLHLTLKFFGEQDVAKADEIRDAIRGVADRHKTMAMRVGGIGAFPNFRRARVVWMGVAQEPRLELIHHDIEIACERLGFEIEARPFRPHLTLGRIKHPLPEERARELSRAGKRVLYDTEFGVSSIDLMESRLGAGGSAYSTFAAATLRSN